MEDLPEIDPQKVSLQIPNEVVAGGFNVVNRAAPVVGEVIQRTAERLVGIGASLKPLFASSLGFGAGTNFKRETGENDENEPIFEQENQASENDKVVMVEAPSQFKRNTDPSQGTGDLTSSPVPADGVSSEEQKKQLESSLLARKVIERYLEKQIEKELVEAETAVPAKREASVAGDLRTSDDQIQMHPASPYYHQQYRGYSPHVKRQAPNYEYYQQYQPYQYVPRYQQQFTNQYYQNNNPYVYG